MQGKCALFLREFWVSSMIVLFSQGPNLTVTGGAKESVESCAKSSQSAFFPNRTTTIRKPTVTHRMCQHGQRLCITAFESWQMEYKEVSKFQVLNSGIIQIYQITRRLEVIYGILFKTDMQEVGSMKFHALTHRCNRLLMPSPSIKLLCQQQWRPSETACEPLTME